MRIKKHFTWIYIFGIAVLLALAVLSLCACEDIKEVVSIRVNSSDDNNEFEIGSFDFNKYTVSVNYSDGTSREIPLAEDMISAEELLYFYSEGTYTVTVNYSNRSDTFDVSFTRKTFGDDIVFEGITVPYDGEAHKITVEGNIPAGTTVSYPSGNAFTKVGKYEVTAVLSRENYVTKQLSTTVEITNADYDLSGYKIEDAVFDYDGTAHQIVAKGSLPEGVKAEYKLYSKKNPSEPLQRLSASDAGEYYYEVTFTSQNLNYNPIPKMTVNMTVNKAKYDMSNVSFSDVTVPYDGKEHKIEIVGTLPQGVTVGYSLTPKINVGTYTATAFFAGNSENYEQIPDMTATLKVTPIEMKTENEDVKLEFYLDPVDNFVYGDGKNHTIAVSMTEELQNQLDKLGIAVSYKIRKGKNVTSGEETVVPEAKDAGDYTIEAIFSFTDPDDANNYTPIPSLFQTFTVDKMKISNSEFSFNSDTFTYSGNIRHPVLNQSSDELLEKNLTVSYLIRSGSNTTGEPISSIQVGTYTVEAVFEIASDDGNYICCNSMFYQYTIEKQTLHPLVQVSDSVSFIYNGNVQSRTLNNRFTLMILGYNITISTSHYNASTAKWEPVTESVHVGKYRTEINLNYKNDTRNYETIPTMYYEYTIEPQPINVDTTYNNTVFTYNGKSQSPVLSCENSLNSKGINVNYSFREGNNTINGKLLSSTSDIGEYTLEVTFTYADNCDYEVDSSVMFCNYSIKEVVYTIPQNVNITEPYICTGKSFASTVESNLSKYPYLTYSVVYYVEGNSSPVTDISLPGKYTAVYSYAATKYAIANNYQTTVTFTVEKQKIDMSSIRFKTNSRGETFNFAYDGTRWYPSYDAYELLKYNLNVYYKVYEGLDTSGYATSAVDPGIYNVHISFEFIEDTPYVELPEEIVVNFAIVSFSEIEVQYDGKQHSPQLTNTDAFDDFDIVLASDFHKNSKDGPYISSATEMGDYYLRVNFYGESDCLREKVSYFKFTIGSILITTSNTVDKTTFTYNGENQCPVYTPNPELAAHGITCSYVVRKGYSYYNDIVTDYSDAGSYLLQVYFNSSDPYYAADKEFLIVYFTIDPIYLTLPTISDIYYTFNGTAPGPVMGVDFPWVQTLEGKKPGEGYTVSYSTTDGSMSSNTPQFCSVGTYKATFRIHDNVGNYQFTSKSFEVYYHILPLELTVDDIIPSWYIHLYTGDDITISPLFSEKLQGLNGFTVTTRVNKGVNGKNSSNSEKINEEGTYTVWFVITMQHSINMSITGEGEEHTIYPSSGFAEYRIKKTVCVVDIATYQRLYYHDETMFDTNSSNYSMSSVTFTYDGYNHTPTVLYKGQKLPSYLAVDLTFRKHSDATTVSTLYVSDPGTYDVIAIVRSIDPSLSILRIVLKSQMTITYP